MQKASGSPCRGIGLSSRLLAVGGVVSPFCKGAALTRFKLFGLARAKSRRKRERIVSVRIVDRAASVHIHKVSGVAPIRGAEPPINGDTGYGPIETER